MKLSRAHVANSHYQMEDTLKRHAFSGQCQSEINFDINCYSAENNFLLPTRSPSQPTKTIKPTTL